MQGDEEHGYSLDEVVVHSLGTIPEFVGVDDLPRLNFALAYTFARLRVATALREGGDHKISAILADQAASQLFMFFAPGLGEYLFLPLANLGDALGALGRGQVEPLLQPTHSPSGGRAPDTGYRQAFVAVAVLTVRSLRDSGMRRSEAHRAVADRLKKLGIRRSRGSSSMTERTVRGWCEKVAEDVGGHKIAGMLNNMPSSDGFKSPPEVVRRRTLEALDFFARAFLPGNGVAKKKPPNPFS